MKKEYTISQLRGLLDGLSGMYDITRVVDPNECRVLDFQEDGQITACEKCYSLWESDQRCMDCSSACAYWSGCRQQKSEHFKNNLYNIHSNPVTIKLDGGGTFDAVLELVTIAESTEPVSFTPVHPRETESVDYKALKFYAQHDGLTKALNAETFYEMARDRLMADPDIQWVVVAANIMQFRMVNSIFGVEKGNQVLIRLANLLKCVADDSEGICGRLNGDHFVLLLQKEWFRDDALHETAAALADEVDRGVYSLCVHFGVYEVTDPTVPVSVMCDRANTALKTIKTSVRRTLAYFDRGMMEKSLFEHEVISGFEKALWAGQFQMYLQPLTDFDGKPFSAEALVRWVRPDGTVTPPASFIEILERAGLIHELDTYIWEQAVRRLSQWKDTPRENLTISVNMSAKDLYSIDVYGALMGLIQKYNVPANKLRLEITETAVIDDPEKSVEVISKLRSAGFFIELDDFGKGHSSLSLLKDIHVDMLKIDMGFLQTKTNKARSDIILRSVIEMAKRLGMEAVTEGVETEEQLRALHDMGCTRYQGFYFSKPIPVEEFEKKY